MFLTLIFRYVLPYTLAIGSFILLTKGIEDHYRKRNEDITVKHGLKWAFCISLIAIVIFCIRYFINTSTGHFLGNLLHNFGVWLSGTALFGKITIWFINLKNHILMLCSKYFMYYLHAFMLTYFFGAFVGIASLKWHINIYRALNVILKVVLKFPILIFKYFSGYETPIKDQILQGVLQAKIRENLNDSYEAAVQGIDDRGKKFEDGAGGTAATQTKKQTAVAVRRAVVTVKTAAGQRKAHILIKQSRETETDRSIENSLKGLGGRISGNSVYFPANATYSSAEKGYIFDSIVAYDPAKELGAFSDVFVNPFEEQNNINLGGKGALAVFKNILLDFWKYICHLTPLGIEKRLELVAQTKFYRDTSADKAKYKVQQNLDLSVIPVPRDPENGNTIDEQRKFALQKANSRVADVKSALNGFGLSGQFQDVQVGGNTAIYSFALPPDPKLPNDFEKVQESISNILHINDKPIITLQAGILKVALNNGVNIPVSFTNMIKERKKGASCIISGMAGVDAMQKPIYFELGDKNPHAILFGKTGTGKTVTIFTIIYSIMSATDPKHLRIAYIDGKGNSFEFMKLDGEHPNPYLYAPPADASGDIEYARALISHLESECRRRIDLFKKDAVAKLSEYNEKHPDDQLPEILAVVDEFSAITQQDKNLKPSESVKKNTIDKFEYLAKMARSVGIRLLLANQSARKELVPGKIAANITGRVSLGVSEPIEAEIALPETGIKVNLVSQPGEFYSIMNGPNNPEHGNSPYIPQAIADKLNDKLTEKFGKATYVKTRKEIMEEEGFATKEDDQKENAEPSKNEGLSRPLTQHRLQPKRRVISSTVNDNSTSKFKIIPPEEELTKDTPLSKIGEYATKDQGKYIPWLIEHIDIVQNNNELNSIDPNKKKTALTLQTAINEKIQVFKRVQDEANHAVTHKHVGTQAHTITGGKDGKII